MDRFIFEQQSGKIIHFLISKYFFSSFIAALPFPFAFLYSRAGVFNLIDATDPPNMINMKKASRFLYEDPIYSVKNSYHNLNIFFSTDYSTVMLDV